MPPSDSKPFLRELDKKLWTAADRLRSNIDRVLALARWETVQDSAKLPPGTEILKERGRPARSYPITSTGKLIDDALEAIEKENPKLKGVLESVASVYDRRTLPFRSTRLPHRARRVKTSDGRRPTLHAQIDPPNRAERVRQPDKAARRGRAAARINLSLSRQSAATTGSLIDLIGSDLKS